MLIDVPDADYVKCSFNHEREFSPSKSRISLIKEDLFGLDLPIICWHCTPCPAMESCPTKALKRNNDGLIYVEQEGCVECEKCKQSCLIGAIKIHPESNIPLICDQCGGKPLCVQECPTKALAYVKVEAKTPRLPSKIFAATLRRWRIIA